MKLYATTTSERASKGQGGNEYLRIIIENEAREPLLHLEINPKDETRFPMNIIAGDLGFIQVLKNQCSFYLDITKGEKQKSEKCIHCEAMQRVSPRKCFRHE